MTGLLDRVAVAVLSDSIHVRGRVYLALLLHTAESGRAWPSVASLARICRTDRRVVQKALRELETASLIKTSLKGRGGRGSRAVTVYSVAPEAHENLVQETIKNTSYRDPSGRPETLTRPERSHLDATTQVAPNGLTATTEDALPPRGDPSGRITENPNATPTVLQPRPQGCSKGDPHGRPTPQGTPQGTPPRAREERAAPDGLPPAPADPDPETQSTPATVPQLIDVLAQQGLEIHGNPFAVRTKLNKAALEGLTTENLDGLINRARGARNPMGLVVHWLEHPGRWRDVLLDKEPGA